MLKDVEPISKVKKTNLRIHKKRTMKGLYYRELIKRAENPTKTKIKNNNNNSEKNKSSNYEEGSLFDRMC